MRKAAAFVVVILGVLGARPSWACSCVGPTPVCSVYWSTSVLFLGHVVRIEHVDGPREYLVHFDVTSSYRGAPGEQAVIHTPDQGSACGLEFAEGHDGGSQETWDRFTAELSKVVPDAERAKAPLRERI